MDLCVRKWMNSLTLFDFYEIYLNLVRFILRKKFLFGSNNFFFRENIKKFLVNYFICFNKSITFEVSNQGKKLCFTAVKKNERQCNLCWNNILVVEHPIWKVFGINFNISMKFNKSYCWIIIIFGVLIKFAKARKMNEFEYEFEFQTKIKTM